MSETNFMAEANAIADAIRSGKPARRPFRRQPATEATPTQLLVLAYMREFFEKEDQLPPVATVAKHFGWASANGAQFHIDGLVRHGLLEHNACGKYRFARPAGEGPTS